MIVTVRILRRVLYHRWTGFLLSSTCVVQYVLIFASQNAEEGCVIQ